MTIKGAMNGDAENGRRLTRLEEFVEVLANEHIQFAEEHKRLLTAQVVLTDRVDKLAQRMDALAEAQAHTDQRLGVLIQMLDDWIKRQP
jgi:hypothetical protein